MRGPGRRGHRRGKRCLGSPEGICLPIAPFPGAWPAFGSGLVPKDKLHLHFEQEYEVYIRDFPIFIGRGFVQCPVAEVRQELAENLYEEETGGLVAGKPHPELFLQYPRGLGYDVSRFDNIELLPQARVYRGLLDETTLNCGWAVSATISTIFVEGTAYERGELEEEATRISLEKAVYEGTCETLRRELEKQRKRGQSVMELNRALKDNVVGIISEKEELEMKAMASTNPATSSSVAAEMIPAAGRVTRSLPRQARSRCRATRRYSLHPTRLPTLAKRVPDVRR